MSAASVLSSFSPSAMPGPVMPMDVAMRFYISHSPPPLRGFLSSYEDLQRAKNRVNQSTTRSHNQQLYKPLRPCLSNQQKALDDGGCIGWNNNKVGKKKVVFADTKGMSLTAIHIFSKFDDEPYRNKHCGGISEELQFDMTDLETATMDLKISSVRNLVLDFKQPSADYLDFRNRLIQNSVCLENCSLQERSLTGTIKVRNMAFEKSVQLRATFDSWASYTDVECTFMNNVYSCQDTDNGQREENQNKMEEKKVEEEEKDVENFYSGGSDEEEANGLEILMEAPEGFRNSDEDRFSESQESSVEDVQDLGRMEMPEEQEEHSKEKGDEQQSERQLLM